MESDFKKQINWRDTVHSDDIHMAMLLVITGQLKMQEFKEEKMTTTG